MADTHLGLRQYGLHWREDDVYARFREAIEYSVREGVDAILISGDMFDRARPPIQAIKAAMDAIKLAESKGIPVYAVLGEHDLPKVRDLPPQYLLDHVKILGTGKTPYQVRQVVDGVEWVIAGISHRPPTAKGLAFLKSKLSELGKTAGRNSVLMMHQNLVNFFQFEQGLDFADIPRTFKYVAMGHLHRRVIQEFGNGSVLAYPGSPEIVRVDEIDEWKKNGKGFYMVDLSGVKPVVHKIDVQVTPQERVRTEYPKHRGDVQKVLRSLPVDRKAILHVEIIMKPGVRADPASDVLALVRMSAGDRIYVRVITKPSAPEALRLAKPEDREALSEEVVIASILDEEWEKKKEVIRVAEAIVKLKNIMSGAESGEPEPAIESLLKERLFWSRKIRLPTMLDVESALTPVKARDITQKPIQKGRGLESFFKR